MHGPIQPNLKSVRSQSVIEYYYAVDRLLDSTLPGVTFLVYFTHFSEAFHIAQCSLMFKLIPSIMELWIIHFEAF